ncbi:MAG TPA: carboxypeptidase-like regulatory domain-containing protein [Longimicrobiales bacterium]|nr:carboxypeptidase-like regulatory domain-containing protein [Longimicrobiales bacterium]
MRRGRRNVIRLPVGLLLASVTAGCGILDPTVCTLEARPAIQMDVLDSISGSPVRGHVRIFARDGSQTFEFDSQDIVLPPTADPDTIVFGPFYLAHERPGTYEVTVEAPGYRLWQRTSVRVRDGECHVQMAELTAQLQRDQTGQ